MNWIFVVHVLLGDFARWCILHTVTADVTAAGAERLRWSDEMLAILC